MTWGVGGGGEGRVLPEGSPEAARGFESSRGYDTGPPEDGGRRPGCLRTAIILVGMLVVLITLLWLAGAILHVFG